MRKIVLIIIAAFLLSGCTGIITGHEYKKEDLVIVYKVVKNGVTTFMTPEEIKEAELDKANIFVTDSYKLLTPQELAQEKGITVNVVGMGTPEGTPIPVGGTISFRKDKDGNVVVTKLNETMCRQIAEAGSGIYVRADNSNTALKAVSGQIGEMQKGNLETKSYAEYDEKFYIFVWIALFLLVIEFYVFNRQNKALNKIKWFD